MGTARRMRVARGLTASYAWPMSSGTQARRGKAKAVSDLMRKGGGALPQLLLRAQRLGEMDAALAAELDPGIAPHVRVANVRDGKLILCTPVAPIATRLTMEAPRLIATLQRSYPGLFTELEVKVTPTLPPRS